MKLRNLQFLRKFVTRFQSVKIETNPQILAQFENEVIENLTEALTELQIRKVDYVAEKIFDLSPFELAFFLDSIYKELQVAQYQGGVCYNPNLDKYLQNGILKRSFN